MFTEQEIDFMKSLGLDCDFNNLSEDDDYWADIEEAVANALVFDENDSPLPITLVCEAILDKIP